MVLAGAQGLMPMKLLQGREKGNEMGNRLPDAPACSVIARKRLVIKPCSYTHPSLCTPPKQFKALQYHACT